MSKNYGSLGTQYPTVNLAVNKSRMKLYGSTTINPTYYLNKGDEFQIELFNPTTDVVLAKISLNGKLISDGGLVLRPGERIFLDRFLDENKKFLFDTYQVDNIEAAKQAIKDNGDLEVAFHKEKTITPPTYNPTGYRTTLNFNDGTANLTNSGYPPTFGTTSITSSGPESIFTSTNTSGHVTLDGMGDNTNLVNSVTGDINLTYNIGDATQDIYIPLRGKRKRKRITESKSIETGRVEKGSTSKQKLDIVDMKFEEYPFHTVSYKMIPTSQKNITSDEVINKYCPNCGKKNKINNKFCPGCGVKR